MGKFLTEDEANEMKVDHPDFRYVMDWSVTDYPVAVFERRLYNEPSEAQIAEYRRNAEIVKRHGGYMLKSEHELAGETPVFTDADCASMRAAVERDLPAWSVYETWNGKGCRSYSVAIKRR